MSEAVWRPLHLPPTFPGNPERNYSAQVWVEGCVTAAVRDPGWLVTPLPAKPLLSLGVSAPLFFFKLYFAASSPREAPSLLPILDGNKVVMFTDSLLGVKS